MLIPEQETPEASHGLLVRAKGGFDYDGLKLEDGELFELRGCRNDQKLMNVGFVRPLGKGDRVIDCTCGKRFIGDVNYSNHLRGLVHPKEAVVLTPTRKRGRPTNRKKVKV